jgi:tRNA (mo5U34)-methyltransferase
MLTALDCSRTSLQASVGSPRARQHSPEELRQLFDSMKPWHHLIDVGGLPTTTESAWGEYLEHPRDLWENVAKLLPDLEGRRVLDVGCNDGYFLFACRRLGAAEVVGIETSEHSTTTPCW